MLPFDFYSQPRHRIWPIFKLPHGQFSWRKI